MSDGSAGSSAAELDSAEPVELDRRVFWSAGTSDTSTVAPSTGDVKGEILATRCVAGMRVKKLWVGLDIFVVWKGGCF